LFCQGKIILYQKDLSKKPMKNLSSLTEGLTGQPMFALLKRVQELQDQGKKIIRFEIGDSAFSSPQKILDSTKEALDKGCTGYVDSQGILGFREAIRQDTYKTLGFLPDLDQILVMPANAIIDFTIRCVVNAGEEVLIPDPGFPTYRAVLNYTGIKGISMRQHHDGKNFYIDLNEVEASINNRAKLIINNSPNNPTGMVMPQQEIENLFSIVERNGLYLLSDEVYSTLSYEKLHFSPGKIDECKEQTVILNSFSKNFGMAGWRLGYAIGPKKLIKKMALLFETTYSCAPHFIQETGKDVLTKYLDLFCVYRSKLISLRDLMVKKLNEIPGVNCETPEGAYYVFANIKETEMSSEKFSSLMLEKAGVAILPGTCFGSFGEGYVRLVFARPEEIIEEGCGKMKAVMKDF